MIDFLKTLNLGEIILTAIIAPIVVSVLTYLGKKITLPRTRKWRNDKINAIADKNLLLKKYFTNRPRKSNVPYVQPRLTKSAPHKEDEPSRMQLIGTRSLKRYFVKKVFKSRPKEQSRIFCILADTGMGKSTALVNLTIDYIRSHKEKDLPYEVALFSLSEDNVLDKINEVTEKEKYILLLDALDENSEAQDIQTRSGFLEQLKGIYTQYQYVIITCRPQFFTNGKEEIGTVDTSALDGRNACEQWFLAPFNTKQIWEYLLRKYGIRFKKIIKAQKIVKQCPDVAIRPLVLSYMDDLIGSNNPIDTNRAIYDTIVSKWIEREIATKVLSVDNVAQHRDGIAKLSKQWLELSSLVAQYMYRHHQLQPTITQAELDSVVNDYNKGLPKEDRVDAQTFRERSMLTRFGEEYRFSHKSFFEYLMAYRFFLDWHEIKSLQGMDFAVQIFNELAVAWQQDKEGFAINGQRFSEAYVAASLHEMGYCLQRLNNFKETEQDYKAALEIRRRLSATDPATHEPNLANTLNNLGALHDDMNDYPQAAEELADALKIYKKLADADPATHEPRLAMTLNNLGNLHRNMNDFPQAAKELAKALKIRRRLANADPATYEPFVAMTLNNLGNLHSDMNDYPQAAKEYAEALKIRKRLATADPAAYEPKLAATLNNLGNLHRNMNDYAQAEKELSEALKIRRRLATANPATYEPNVAMTLGNIAMLLADQGCFAEAERNAKESRDIFAKCAERCHEAYDGDLKKAEEILAEIREMRGKADDTSES